MRTTEPKVVIGYGNDLRSDDASGRRVADEIARQHLPGVLVRSVHQLTPELTEALGTASLAVFVDARYAHDEEDDVRVERILLDAPTPTTALGHFGDPRDLLRLTRTLYGRAPQAWWVTIPATEFRFGETLSPRASEGVEKAIREVRRLLADEEERCTN